MNSIPKHLSAFREAYSAMLTSAAELSDAIEREACELPTVPADIDLIMGRVAAFHGYRRATLRSRNRVARLSTARLIAIALCRELTPHGVVVIAKAFARDHALVTYAVITVADRAATDASFRNDLDLLRGSILAARKGALIAGFTA